MNSELGEFLRSQWGTASPNQLGSKTNPFVDASQTGERLSNGTRVNQNPGVRGLGSLQATPIGVAPEVPITAASLGVPQPDCGPKMQAVIDPATGRWTCQPAGESGGILKLAMYAGLGYLAWKWWQDQQKTKHHHKPKPTSEEYDDVD